MSVSVRVSVSVTERGAGGAGGGTVYLGRCSIGDTEAGSTGGGLGHQRLGGLIRLERSLLYERQLGRRLVSCGHRLRCGGL